MVWVTLQKLLTMSQISMLTVVLLVPLAAATNIVVVSDYNQASDTVKDLVDAVTDNYLNYYGLELVKYVPKLSDPEKCDAVKAEYIENLAALLEETHTVVKQSSEEENTIEVDSKEGNMILPYIPKTPGETITCEKALTTEDVKELLQQKYTEIVTSLPTEKLGELKETVVKHPKFKEMVGAYEKGANKVEDAKEALQQKFTVVSSLPAEKLVELKKTVMNHPKYKELVDAYNKGEKSGKEIIQQKYEEVISSLPAEKLEELTKNVVNHPKYRELVDAYKKGEANAKETMQQKYKEVDSSLPAKKLEEIKKTITEHSLFKEMVDAYQKGAITIEGFLKKLN